MNSDLAGGFRIAIFGRSGSGKSTAAARLHAGGRDILWIEASRDLIEGADFNRDASFVERGELGLAYFAMATRAEGSGWAAKRVARAVGVKSNILVTGVRGLENARRLRSEGFFCVFIDCDLDTAARRISLRERVSLGDAMEHLAAEDRAYEFDLVAAECDFRVDGTGSPWSVERALVNLALSVTRKRHVSFRPTLCRRCVVPLATETGSWPAGLCPTCEAFDRRDRSLRGNHVLAEILNDIRPGGGHSGILGFSGGKDSSVALNFLTEQNVAVSTFTVDMGYYPLTMLARAATESARGNIPHTQIDGRDFIDEDIRSSYEATALLYDRIDSIAPEEFKARYQKSRLTYSVKHRATCAFPRVCVLCRKSVIPAYYSMARAKSAKYVFLGINEWAGLASSVEGDATNISGVRKLAPYGDADAVYVVHLPYLLGSSLTRNRQVLMETGWSLPPSEDLVETNSNSCLLAKASEMLFAEKLGFHPDVTRLGREVTVGFLTRSDALRALEMIAPSAWSVRQVLEYAEILVPPQQ